MAPVERFAALCALLDDGFASRAEILAAARLDDATWQQLRAEWLTRFAGPVAPQLALQFSRAYAHARRHPGYLALPEGAPTPRNAAPAGMEVGDAGADGDSPVEAPDTDPADRTAAGAFPLAGPAVPFMVPPPWLPASAPSPTEPPRHPQVAAAVDPTDVTLPCVPPPPEAVLPFAAPAPGAGRGMRLVRFDTQTGAPLATPYWVDDTTPGSADRPGPMETP